jgi:hypothetical protein
MTIFTWCPNAAREAGKDAETSANPPVLAKGVTSEEANRIFKGFKFYFLQP